MENRVGTLLEEIKSMSLTKRYLEDLMENAYDRGLNPEEMSPDELLELNKKHD